MPKKPPQPLRPQDAMTRFDRLLAAMALAGSLVIFLTGLSAHLDRQLKEKQRYQQALLAALRTEKEEVAFLADAPPGISVGVSGSEAVELVKRIESILPERVWIETIEVSKGGAAISGFSPMDAGWPEGSAPIFSPSDRSGVQRFSLSNPLAAQQ